ncbi:MAG: ATP-binding protein [Bacillota bacterium]|jgi:signal transduction histidine kinase|uniref:sensor histidine kinase n=1 Tax=Fictibacillus TaxID=1329200 RepID=UPI0018CDC1F2|nr:MULTISPECIES: HAMP domain-containing sensor histidine kinase [unclassified Fictibacillus]MBH0157166.1 HAMP domain-containing histidine kinase [Fictibacillus sp. 5RED26]MBH0159487.1 HAMP domain-containing histidine kinase [Fictibacillus sp. 26RED30]MBH0163714.1 HAMP domain-containing histidine kinase [Fictibacillus sp. 7GRE50]MBH0169660.1 HAMP domain-containing histidine kinase [Fictibacillus sp. 18YEL24]MBH0174160.1 HAMP domain-containing histidine kinase [Fictibacillus sp. 23RED33]
MKNSIIFKISGSFILLFLVVLFPTGIVIYQGFSGFYYNEVRQNINKLSEQYAHSINNTNDKEFISMFESLSRLTRTDIFITDSKGNIIASTGVEGLEEGKKISTKNNNLLSRGQTINKEYEEPISKAHHLMAGKPIKNNHTFKGSVFVLSSIEEIHESIKKVRLLLTLVGIGAFFLMLGFTYFLSRKLAAPLLQMEKATKEIAKGNLGVPVEYSSNDEVGQLGKAINLLKVELKQYRDSRQDFLASISHELRTPITYIEGYSKALKNKLYKDDNEKVLYLDTINRASLQLKGLINDLFDLSKMDIDQFQLTKQQIDIIELAESILVKVKLRAGDKDIGIEFIKNTEEAYLYADALRIEQILLNLLENAIRYTDHGSVILEINKSKKFIGIRVKDTGKGIPEKELPFIFDRFYRVERSRSRQHGGSGLGLSIVKKLVELHDGTIEVKSDPGKGSEFIVSIPINQKVH